MNCPNCHVSPGQLHRKNCDLERCSYCGLQAMMCQHAGKVPDDDRLAWPGYDPDMETCKTLGLFAKFVNGKWESCGANEPGAFPDLNTLYATFRWSRKHKKWVKV